MHNLLPNDLEAYPDDRQKINTAISFFEGLTLDWINPFLLMAPIPPILTDWSLFVKGLNDMFGDPNVPLNAARTLEHLSMADNHLAQKYVIDFAHWAPLTGYNEIALANMFYNGLPSRLKDKISETGRPSDFVGLRNLTLSLDRRYWERQAELSRSPKTHQSTSSSQTGGKASEQKTQSNPPQSTSSTRQPSAPRQNSKPQETKPSILNSAGRLTEEEKQRRKDNNLCAFCGASDHARPACPKVGPPRPPQNQQNNRSANNNQSKPTPSNQSSTGSRVGRATVTIPAQTDPPASIETVPTTPPPGNK